jgi:hypothetical protein
VARLITFLTALLASLHLLTTTSANPPLQTDEGDAIDPAGDPPSSMGPGAPPPRLGSGPGAPEAGSTGPGAPGAGSFLLVEVGGAQKEGGGRTIGTIAAAHDSALALRGNQNNRACGLSASLPRGFLRISKGGRVRALHKNPDAIHKWTRNAQALQTIHKWTRNSQALQKRWC